MSVSRHQMSGVVVTPVVQFLRSNDGYSLFVRPFVRTQVYGKPEAGTSEEGLLWQLAQDVAYVSHKAGPMLPHQRRPRGWSEESKAYYMDDFKEALKNGRALPWWDAQIQFGFVYCSVEMSHETAKTANTGDWARRKQRLSRQRTDGGRYEIVSGYANGLNTDLLILADESRGRRRLELEETWRELDLAPVFRMPSPPFPAFQPKSSSMSSAMKLKSTLAAWIKTSLWSRHSQAPTSSLETAAMEGMGTYQGPEVWVPDVTARPGQNKTQTEHRRSQLVSDIQSTVSDSNEHPDSRADLIDSRARLNWTDQATDICAQDGRRDSSSFLSVHVTPSLRIEKTIMGLQITAQLGELTSASWLRPAMQRKFCCLKSSLSDVADIERRQMAFSLSQGEALVWWTGEVKRRMEGSGLSDVRVNDAVWSS